MGRRSKKDKPPPMIRGILGANTRMLRDRLFAGLPNETARNRALAKRADTSLSQIQRVVSGEVGVSVDVVAQLSEVFEVTPRDLLTPYYASKAARPVNISKGLPHAPAAKSRSKTA